MVVFDSLQVKKIYVIDLFENKRAQLYQKPVKINYRIRIRNKKYKLPTDNIVQNKPI